MSPKTFVAGEVDREAVFEPEGRRRRHSPAMGPVHCWTSGSRP
jgi:hypothetical protein